MKQLVYNDHLAYELDDTEQVSSLGLKALQRVSSDVITLPSVVCHNGRERLLYPLSGGHPVTCSTLSSASLDVRTFLEALSKALYLCDTTAFLEREYIRLQEPFLLASDSLKNILFPVFPIQMIDISSWSSVFMTCIASILENTNDSSFDNLRTHLETSSADEVIEYIISTYNTASGDTTHTADPMCEVAMRYSGEYGVYSFFLTASTSELIIGSDPSATGTIINNPAVSRKHCRIFRRDGHFYIQDLGSTNHTLLNDRVLVGDEELLLRENDTVQIADMIFVVQFSTRNIL